MTIGITTVSLVYTSLLMLAKEHYTIPNFTMNGLYKASKCRWFIIVLLTLHPIIRPRGRWFIILCQGTKETTQALLSQVESTKCLTSSAEFGGDSWSLSSKNQGWSIKHGGKPQDWWVKYAIIFSIWYTHTRQSDMFHVWFTYVTGPCLLCWWIFRGASSECQPHNSEAVPLLGDLGA